MLLNLMFKLVPKNTQNNSIVNISSNNIVQSLIDEERKKTEIKFS